MNTVQPTRTTGKKPTECSHCNGWGYTDHTATLIERTATNKFVTVKQGSSCPVCHGTGQRESRILEKAA